MRPTPSSYRSYICLFCRTHCRQTFGPGRRAYSLLATSSTQPDSPPPPNFDSETAKNIQSDRAVEGSISTSQNDFSVARAKKEDSSEGSVALHKTVRWPTTSLVQRTVYQRREPSRANPKSVLTKSPSRKRQESSKRKLVGLLGTYDRLGASLKNAGDVTDSWRKLDLRPLVRVAKLLRDELSKVSQEFGSIHDWIRGKLDRRELTTAHLKEMGPESHETLSKLGRFWGRDTVVAVMARPQNLESIFSKGALWRKLKSALQPSQEEDTSPKAKVGEQDEEEEGEQKILKNEQAGSGSRAPATADAETGDDANETKGLPKDTSSKRKGTKAVRNQESSVKPKKTKAKSVPKDEGSRSLKIQQRRRHRFRIPEAGKIRTRVVNYSVNADALEVIPVQTQQPPPPTLTYDLQRVLFNPGIYQLQDPRSRVYNFDPYLKSIMPVTEFDYTALTEYVESSRDEKLRQLANNLGKKYLGSSSSMTPVLSHFHFLLSGWRGVNTSTLSRSFPDPHATFAFTLRAPAVVFLRHKDGMYAVDADKEFDDQHILVGLGKSLEKLLTTSKENFELYRRSSGQKVPETERNLPVVHHYSHLGDFLMRAQIDAWDPRLPGSGVFDLKSRAVLSIRRNALDFETGLGYQIRDRFGQFESYEREFYDMIRSAFLKYSLQARVGFMDGIFVAYHNIERLFGFQYISLPEMDLAIHGQADTTLGDREFKLSLTIWNRVLDQVTAKFPGRSLRIHFETRQSQVQPWMYVFAEPVDEDAISNMQAKGDEIWLQYVENLRQRNAAEPDGKEQHEDTSSLPFTAANTCFVDEISQADTAAEEPPSTATTDAKSTESSQPELCCLIVTIQSRVNQVPVERPTLLDASDEWTVDFDLTEVPDEKKHTLYKACKRRRKSAFDDDYRLDPWYRHIAEHITALTKKGRLSHQAEEELESRLEPVNLYGLDK